MFRLFAAFAFTIAALVGAAAVPASAYDVESTSPVNVDTAGIALRGYDPVAYITIGAPVVGDAALTMTHNGATYRFANSAHLLAFAADPDRYAPGYGGFCQMGAALGKKLDGDPAVFRVANGRLYLYVNQDAMAAFLGDVPTNTVKADTNWPLIMNKAPKDL